MMISFAAWLPVVLLLLGIILIKAKAIGWKIVGTVLVTIGGLLLVLQIWIYSRHPGF